VSIVKIKPLHTHPNLSSAVLAFTLLSTALAYAQGHKSAHWSYDGDEGPSHWGDLNPISLPAKTDTTSPPLTFAVPRRPTCLHSVRLQAVPVAHHR